MSEAVSLIRVKVFPLSSVVLFPQTAVPLHIFEPRYRQMVSEALATDRLFAMAQPVVGETQQGQGPALAPIACLGKIVYEESLEEGRFNLLLHGVSRVRLLWEVPNDKLYREFEAEMLPEEDYPGLENNVVRQTVMEWVKRTPNARVPPWLTQVYGGTLADGVAAAFVDDVALRWQFLAELSPQKRLLLAMDYVTHKLAESPGRSSSGTLH